MDMESYCIVAKEFSLRKIMDFHAKIFRLSEEEAFEKTRKNGPFILKNSSYGKAEEIYRKSLAAGFPALFTMEEYLPEIPEPDILNSLKMGELSLEYSRADKACKIPYDKIRLVCAAAVREERAVMDLGEVMEKIKRTAYPSLAGKRKEIKRHETFFAMDILTEEGKRIAIKSDEFDFSCLGGKKSYSSEENFRTLLSEISSLSVKARLSPCAETLIENGKKQLFSYEGTVSYENEILSSLIFAPVS